MFTETALCFMRFLPAGSGSCFLMCTRLYIYNKDKAATTLYLAPVSDTPQSILHSHSSQTPRPGSGAGTCSHPPSHGGRRAASETRSNIGLQPRRPRISPKTQYSLHTEHYMSHAWIRTHSTPPHPLCAHVHTLVHGHVLNDSAERQSQSDIVRPVETALENGAAV